jgi:hypothetical protein
MCLLCDPTFVFRKTLKNTFQRMQDWAPPFFILYDILDLNFSIENDF